MARLTRPDSRFQRIHYMCGITGAISRQPLAQRVRQGILSANEQLRHRGPDGVGMLHVPRVALGMRRLSIIDLACGWQPLYNEDRSLALICNGEIYNFVELRTALEGRGHRFSTGSDCETIAHLYEEYGDRCVHHLRGMFAFALWDAPRGRLLIARDRMGEKPMYIAESDGMLLFASELRSLLATGLVPRELDPAAVDLFFHYQFIPEPWTAVSGIRKLPAAHVLTVDVDTWRVEEREYWRAEDAPPLDGDRVMLVREELEVVAGLVVRSDVPVGVALSAGLDSSAVAALAHQRYPGTIHAFSIGYPERPPSDERAEAKTFADHLGIPLHEIELDSVEMTQSFPSLVEWRDDPIADISGFGYYAVSRAAREHGVPVLLQGQGGDELFWGYWWVQQAAQETARKQRSRPWKRPFSALTDYLRMQGFRDQGFRTWLATAGGLRPSLNAYLRDLRSPHDQMVFYDLAPDFRLALGEARDIYSSAWRSRVENVNPCAAFTFPMPWTDIDARITSLIMSTYLRENGIAQGDRLSMASSVELRLPLVDYRLIETVIGLRKAHPDSHEPPKAWWRTVLADVLPPWVLNRRKRGFTPPIHEWHRALFDAYGATLRDGYLVQVGVLDPAVASALSSGPFPSGAVVPLSFKALVLETWCRRCLA